MTELAVLLLVAAIGMGISRYLGIPVMPLFLLGGIAISPLAGDRHHDHLEHALELGLVFLVFATGIELNPQRFAQQRRAVLLVGFLQFTLVAAIGYLMARFIGFKGIPALYMALALSTSSTLVVVRILIRGRRIAEPFGRLVVGVLLIQDILIILSILVLSGLNQGAAAVFENIGWASLLGLLTLAVHRWSPTRFLLQDRCNNEVLLLVVLTHLFLFVGMADSFGLPLVVGAFCAGFSLSPFPVNGVARTLLASLSDFFLAIFFTALGVFVGVPDDPVVLARGMALGLCLILVTPPVVTFIAETQGLSSRNAIESGILLAQSSEFALMLGITGQQMESLSLVDLQVIAWMAAFTMTLTPLLDNERVIRWLLRFHPEVHRKSSPAGLEDHILVLGFGTGGMWVVRPLLAAGHQVLVVDDDPAIIGHLDQAGIRCLRGDGSDLRVLTRAGAADARLIISSMRRPCEAVTFLRHFPGTPAIVRVFEREDAEAIERLGGIPVLNSEASAETFMEWFRKTDHTRRPTDDET